MVLVCCSSSPALWQHFKSRHLTSLALAMGCSRCRFLVSCLLLQALAVESQEGTGTNKTVIPLNATNKTLLGPDRGNVVHCRCGVTCVQTRQVGFSQPCECTPCPSNNLRGSQPRESSPTTAQMIIENVDAKSLTSFVGPHDRWDATGPHDATNTALYCRCGRRCDMFVSIAVLGLRCMRFSCLRC